MAQVAQPALAVPVSRAHLHRSFRLWLPLVSLALFPFWRYAAYMSQMLNPVVATLHGFLRLTFEVFPNNIFSPDNAVTQGIVCGVVWFLIGFALDELSARCRAGASTIPGFAYAFTGGVILAIAAAWWRARYWLLYVSLSDQRSSELFAELAGVWALVALNCGLWGTVAARLFVYWKNAWVHIRRPQFTPPWKRGFSKREWATFVEKWLLTIPVSIFLLQGMVGIFDHSSPADAGFAVVYTLLVLAALHFRWLFPDAPSHPFAIQTWKQAMRNWRKRTWMAVGVAIWIAAALLVHNLKNLPLIIVLFLVLAYTRWVMPDLKDYAWAIWAAIAFGLVLSFTGSYHPLLDAAFFAAAGLAGYIYWFTSRSKYRQLTAGIALFMIAWVLCSLGDMLVRQAPAELSPGRFRSLRQQPEFQGKRVGVALSGGGIRAGLVHAGALNMLENLGIPVTHVAGVSGGSITASYYALGGPPAEFKQAVLDHKFNLYRDLFDLQNLGRIVFSGKIPESDVRLFPWPNFTRTDVEAAALDRVLLRSRTLKSLPVDAPALLIGTTELESGRAVGFTPKWVSSRFLLRPPGENVFPNAVDLYENYRFQNASTCMPLDTDIQLSRLVSASSAFPLAFAPMKVKFDQELIFPGQTTFVLADGGVTDNSGMTLLLDADWRANRRIATDMDREWRLDAAIAIDGGALFISDVKEPLSNVSRAMDIVDSRFGATLPNGIDASVTPEKLAKRVLLSPSAYLDNSLLLRPSVPLGFGQHRYANEEKQYFRAIYRQLSKLDGDGLAQMFKLHPDLFDREMRRFASEIAAQYSASADDGPTRRPPLQEEVRRMMRNLAWRFQSVLGAEIDLFLKTPTLKDNLDPVTTDTLYALGEDLVVLNEPDIRAALLGPVAENSHLLRQVERHRFLCEMNSEMENAYRVREPQTEKSHVEPREIALERDRLRQTAYENMIYDTVQGCSPHEIEKRMNDSTKQNRSSK